MLALSSSCSCSCFCSNLLLEIKEEQEQEHEQEQEKALVRNMTTIPVLALARDAFRAMDRETLTLQYLAADEG